MAGTLAGALVVVLVILSFMEKRREARVWREGHAAIHGVEEFTPMDPPRKYVPRHVLLGHLTTFDLLDIECRSRESRNLLVGPTPSPLEIANLNHVARLALVDVPRLLAHIRKLEDRK